MTEPNEELAREATPTDGLSGRAVRSFLWSALSYGSTKVVVFLVTLVLARLLDPADFGVVAAGLSLIVFLEIGLDLGVGAAVVYEQELGLSHRVRTAFTLNLLIAVLCTLAGVAASPAIAAFFHVPQAVGLFRVLFCYLLLRGAGQVQDAVLQRDLRYRVRTVVEVARALARGVVSVVLAFAGAGAWALVAGLLSGELAAVVLYFCFVGLVPTLRIERATSRALLGFGLPVLGLKIVNSFTTNSDDLIIGNRLGAGPLGLYTIGYQLRELCIDNVYWIFGKVAYSVYSKARAYGPEAFKNTMLRALRLVTLFGFTAGTGLAIVAPAAVPLLFSSKWAPAVPATVFLALASGLASIGYASGDIFPAVGRPGTLLRLTTVCVVVMVLGFWFAAPYGITAVAMVHFFFVLFYSVLRLHVANRLVGSTWWESLVAMRPAVLATLGITATALPTSLLLPLSWLGLVATVLAGTAGALVMLRVFNRGVLTDLAALAKQGFR
ncbi:MAG: lipopolysaccharide biosynthesis protein [Sciscionella sp.]